ncbi:MAG: hypothetical protein R3B40_04195 [Polyangiales bacterium]|nr:hypothetical protein [Myxococcales bacterium]MCB9660158.1 hypothetical protein [Sandaracinaceae bacterium]
MNAPLDAAPDLLRTPARRPPVRITTPHALRVLMCLTFALGLPLSGCAGSSGSTGDTSEQASEDDDDWGDEVPENTGTEYHGSAIEALGITGPDTPWADMNEEEREFYMIGKVLPIMHELFARHDPQEYQGFSCETCHGTNMREVHFEMPVATIFRLPEPGSSGWAAMEATQGDAVRFMRDEVTPTMGTLLGMEDYTCFHCHTRR